VLALAATKISNKSIAGVAASMKAAEQKFCTRAIADAPTIQTALSTINTLGAVLLGLGVAL